MKLCYGSFVVIEAQYLELFGVGWLHMISEWRTDWATRKRASKLTMVYISIAKAIYRQLFPRLLLLYFTKHWVTTLR